MKWPLAIIFVLVVAYAGLSISARIIFGEDAFSCGSDSKYVHYAKSLSEERLAKLYLDIESFAKSETYFYDVNSGSDASPPQLSDLAYNNLRLNGFMSRIMLNGCFDHYVTLTFHGIYRSNKPKAIVLTWGEHSDYGKLQLWPKE